MSETKAPRVGDRVRMDHGKGKGWLGADVPDLGVGTVVATKGEYLMEGMYVEVEWDHPEFNRHGATRAAIQSLKRVC